MIPKVKIEPTKPSSSDIEAKTIKTERIEAKEAVLGAETLGKGIIPAGEKKAKISTPLVSENSKIYITPTIRLNGRVLYVEEKSIIAGESFEVELDGEVSSEDISFNWLIFQ